MSQEANRALNSASSSSYSNSQNEVRRTASGSSREACWSERSADELQNVILRAQEFAKNFSSNVSVDQVTIGFVKEAVDKLAVAHNKVLEAEKSKLKSMQPLEHKAHNNQDVHEASSTSNILNMRPKIQRNYKLTSKTSFEVWFDCLKTELTSWMLLYLIDPKIPEPTGLSEIEVILRENSVKDIIISHIDEDYHKKILGLTEPMEILQKLRDSRKGEGQFYYNFNKNETI